MNYGHGTQHPRRLEHEKNRQKSVVRDFALEVAEIHMSRALQEADLPSGDFLSGPSGGSVGRVTDAGQGLAKHSCRSCKRDTGLTPSAYHLQSISGYVKSSTVPSVL